MKVGPTILQFQGLSFSNPLWPKKVAHEFSTEKKVLLLKLIFQPKNKNLIWIFMAKNILDSFFPFCFDFRANET